jgi:UDP-N-acetylmuramoylalanine-D-glutamate ligase
MVALRRCQCGALLAPSDIDQCQICIESPSLSGRARAVGEMRRREVAIITEIERQIKNVEGLMRRINVKIGRIVNGNTDSGS